MTAQLPIKERLEKIASWREKYGAGHNVMLPAEEAEALARFVLAAHEQEPVATLDVQSGRTDGKKFALVYSLAAHQLPDDVYFLHIHPAPVPAVPDEWRSSLQELVKAMRDYEMDVDEPAPYKHREMMRRAEALLNGGKS